MTLGIYIDCGSLWHGAPRAAAGEPKKRVNYAKLAELIKLGVEDDDAQVVAKAYVIARVGVDVVGFQYALENMGYKVQLIENRMSAREKLVKDILTDWEEKRWTSLAVASEDAMITPTINALRREGVDVRLYAFKAPCATHKLDEAVLEAA